MQRPGQIRLPTPISSAAVRSPHPISASSSGRCASTSTRKSLRVEALLTALPARAEGLHPFNPRPQEAPRVRAKSYDYADGVRTSFSSEGLKRGALNRPHETSIGAIVAQLAVSEIAAAAGHMFGDRSARLSPMQRGYVAVAAVLALERDPAGVSTGQNSEILTACRQIGARTVSASFAATSLTPTHRRPPA